MHQILFGLGEFRSQNSPGEPHCNVGFYTDFIWLGGVRPVFGCQCAKEAEIEKWSGLDYVEWGTTPTGCLLNPPPLAHLNLPVAPKRI